MRISQGDLEYYRQTLDDIATQAGEYVRDSIQSGGGSGVTAMREAAIAAIQDSVGIHGEMAQAWAGQLFDEVCAAEGIGPFDFELFDDIIDFAMLEDKVRYFAKALVEGDSGRFLDDCSTLADFYARRCNYEGMVRNCYHNHVRYARIPTGTDTCDFCLMLASRGAVYYDKARAEEGSHVNCDCVTVCMGPSTSIDGYDPDMLYDMWQGRVSATAHERAGRNGTSYQIERMRIMDSYKASARRAHQRHRYRR
jgi:hypothetical protein